uniref:Extended-spectrum beta-lactamase n=1 Tax=Escherichia coli TaxID=562 RepID=A0A7I8HMM9_ECOLX|nr:extended-spectrum beta-lactamase [Escherichia coli]
MRLYQLTAISFNSPEFRCKKYSTLLTIIRLRKSTSMGRCHWLRFARPRYSTAITWGSISSLLALAARLPSPRSPDSWETKRSVSTVPSRRSTPPFRAIRVIPLHLGQWRKLCGISRWVKHWATANGRSWSHGSKAIPPVQQAFRLDCLLPVLWGKKPGGGAFVLRALAR